ncbi:Aste57867_11255 [Aphanomyces stellatus]|uniref:Aste57867_11255 protein n=1 Tax=Aphanomyces stellatus TaxID=120398 RepID=A0A485KSK7_9STRA|nr:hypothetical protein As57867_011213 [Aphanomyces stellatus]VFT88119.1 Aste57867_11255 [Aphanomyces stellatus]
MMIVTVVFLLAEFTLYFSFFWPVGHVSKRVSSALIGYVLNVNRPPGSGDTRQEKLSSNRESPLHLLLHNVNTHAFPHRYTRDRLCCSLSPWSKPLRGKRRGAYELLLARSDDGKLPYGAVSSVARHYKCHRATISRLWARARRSVLAGSPVADTAARIRGNSGGKRLRTAEEIEATIKAVPQEDRQTLRSLEASSGIKKTTIIRHMKENMKLKGRSNYVKPLLTDANKITRLRYALNILLPGSNGTHFFDNM